MRSNIQAKIRPIILSGGVGTRLWPLSCESYPKQFTRVIGNESLFVSTLKRVNDRKRYVAPIIIGHIEHMSFIIVELVLLGITDATIILEPCGRNTASAAIIAALHESEKDVLHLVLPCDHYIADEQEFHKAVSRSACIATDDHIVLFGMTPDHPETGYGYIIPGETIDGTCIHKIGVFTEKPNATFAAVLIQQKALWNSGMFFYDPALLCKEAKNLAADHYDKCRVALGNAMRKDNCIILRLEDYLPLEHHAFDTLIMEATQCGAVLPCNMGWSDVGSWHSLWQMAQKDESGNAIQGPIAVKNVNNSYLRSDGVPVAVLGVKDCIVIATNNNVLVAKRAESQAVKELVPGMAEASGQAEAINDYGMRPWGIYKNIAQGKNFRVKKIIIKPGGAISLQAHSHRAEHWIVISGMAKAECNGEVKSILPNESAFIPQGAMHRLSNTGDEDLHIVEVQSGEYLGEDDIMRFEDLYGRV